MNLAWVCNRSGPQVAPRLGVGVGGGYLRAYPLGSFQDHRQQIYNPRDVAAIRECVLHHGFLLEMLPHR